jgi:cardiolipin synthase
LSLLLAREANVVVRDGPFSKLLRDRLLETAELQSSRVDPQAYAHRSPWQRSMDIVALGVMRVVLFLIGRSY